MTAPILQDNRTTTTISLPGYEGSEVVIYDNVLLQDTLGMKGLIQEKSPEELIKVLPKLIKSWNFVDTKGEAMPVTAENLGLLSVDAVIAMTDVVVKTIQAAVEAKKKATQG